MNGKMKVAVMNGIGKWDLKREIFRSQEQMKYL